MVIFAATSVSDIVDEFRDFSLVDREDRQMLVKTLRRRFPEGGYTKRTSFSLIVVLSEILPAVLCETIGESIRPHSTRF